MTLAVCCSSVLCRAAAVFAVRVLSDVCSADRLLCVLSDVCTCQKTLSLLCVRAVWDHSTPHRLL